MLMLDRDGTTLAPERNTSLAGRIAGLVVRLGAWSTRSHPPVQGPGKAAQVAGLYSSSTGAISHHHVLRGASE